MITLSRKLSVWPELASGLFLPLAQAGAPEITEPYGITDPTNIVFPHFPWGWIIAGGVACVLVGLAITWLVLRKRKPAPYVSAAEVALRRLAVLEKEAATQDSYHYSIAVDDVLRDYLSQILGVRADHQTSQEFLRTLDLRGGLRESLVPVIQGFMATSDAFKFARLPGGAEDNQQLVRHAREVVEGSRR